MPTGYTADLPDTLEAYAMRCARAFGALIEMRDESRDAKIPTTFKPSPYHKDRLREARQELACVKKWTHAQAEKEAVRLYLKAVREYEKMANERVALRERYNRMIEKVQTWKEPSGQHAGLKAFMLEQLTESREHDTTIHQVFPRIITGQQHREARIHMLMREIAYHSREYKKETADAKIKTAWVRQLRASVKGK